MATNELGTSTPTASAQAHDRLKTDFSGSTLDSLQSLGGAACNFVFSQWFCAVEAFDSKEMERSVLEQVGV